MASSTSLYRKYRSHNFDELVGQEPVVRTLKNAIATGRIAHAYLFTGPRGVGKTSAARLLARAANCTADGEDKPCNKCPNCLAVSRDIVTDLIEIDAASNTGVDNIRDVIERANFAPSVWHTKFYIVDEVHMLSMSAFNALLKTLEEPPPHTSFILATTEIHKVPATVASRCQRFDFRRIPLSAMLGWLEHVCAQEGIQADRAALELVSRHSTGSLRDALSLLDQLQVYSEGGITLRGVQEMLGASGTEEVATFVDCLVAGDLAGGLRQINRVLEEGLDLRQFNRQIVEHLRSLMLVKSGAASQSESALLDVTEEMRSRIQAQAAKVDIPGLLKWLHAFAEADANLRSTTYRQLPLEMALVTATLRPEETQGRPPARDHSAELSAGIEQIGIVAPKPRGNTPAPAEPARPVHSEMPPPIHSELGHAANGRAQPAANNGSSARPPQRSAPEQEREAAPIYELESTAPTAQRMSEPGNSNSVTDAAPDAPPPLPANRDPATELERLNAAWPKLVDHIKAKSRPIAAAFNDPNQTRPHAVVGSTCTISFRDPIHVTRSKQEKQREVIEEALSWVLGYPCRVESITFAEAEVSSQSEGQARQPADGNGPNTAREKPSPYDTPRGKAAMNIFGINKFDDTNKES
ncbi:MAG TPA: DNA polymerase III subunit gamma/tau [Chloroflexia bacterium]|nr:DNA polymerase III subunit gamma/tau [Chloroflexia bacterium]